MAEKKTKANRFVGDGSEFVPTGRKVKLVKPKKTGKKK